jgi:hypothetical protein
MHLAPAPSRADRGRPVLDGHPLGAPRAQPLFEIVGAAGRLALLFVARSLALNAPVVLYPKQAAVLPLPPLRVLDPSDRTVGDLVVETVVDGGEPLRLGMDAVDGQVEVPVLRVAVQPIDRLMLGEAHLVQEHLGGLISLGRRRLLIDLVVPTRNFTERSAQDTSKQLHDDLRTLGLRERRGHDLRRTFVTLAQVDGARRDLLETMSHGPRGDIVSIYTSFPWPALCAEIAKLKIELRSPSPPDCGSKGFATGFATVHVRGRNRWLKSVTPSGIGSIPDVTKQREDSSSPTENRETRSSKKRVVTLNGSKVAKIAAIARNALRNYDLHRAIEVLEELRRLGEGESR